MRSRRNARCQKCIFCGLVAMAAAATFFFVLIFFIFVFQNRDDRDYALTRKVNETQESCAAAGNETQKLRPAGEYSAEMIEEARKMQAENKALLVLVNKENEFDNSAPLPLRNICRGKLQAAKVMYEDLCALLEDASKEGHSYWIASAFRSRERQQELVDQYVGEKRKQGMTKAEALEETLKETMPAGFSEHETGLALDILAASNTNMDVSQVKTSENQWLREHAYEYGFILRYPEEKEDITAVRYEPWHFRYVGKEAAEFIAENNLTLEEFYTLLE